MAGSEKKPTPRGKVAPPPARRRGSQRERIFEAAATVFARDGYVNSSAESIAREAGVSKATFYEHFDSREACMLDLFDHGAWQLIRELTPPLPEPGVDYPDHVRRTIARFLEVIERHRDLAITVFAEARASGEEGRERSDELIALFAGAQFHDNQTVAPDMGAPVFREQIDSLVAMSAATTMAVRQLQSGDPEDIQELVPVLSRMLLSSLNID